jgi:hypothetical protein
MQMRRRMFALAVSAGLGLFASSSFADISGTVSFEGQAPEPEQIDMSAVKECAMQHPDGAFDESLVVTDGKLANVVVSVKEAPAGGETPKTPALLDQKGCQYHPHVIALMTGQPITVKNSDPFLHNVHSLAIDNPAFNFGQPNVDQGRPVDPMKAPERFKIKCDVHPWMGAHISVFEHPYFAVTKADGTFKIPGNLPDGDYKLVFWHEKLGEQEKDVKVAGGKAEGADASFKPAAARADDAHIPATAEVRLAVFNAKAETAKAGAEKPCCATGVPSKAAALKAVVKVSAEQPQASAK